ncbi:MAG: hypothetical protein ACREXS_06225 [Gammaproteobacteria bacterium]
MNSRRGSAEVCLRQDLVLIVEPVEGLAERSGHLDASTNLILRRQRHVGRQAMDRFLCDVHDDADLRGVD